MKAWLINLYDSAPIPVKRIFMNGYARYLQKLREGASFEAAIETMERIDRASSDAREAYQLDRVNDILTWAEERVPHYHRRALTGSGPGGRLTSLEEIERLPLLSKADVRNDKSAFTARDVETYYGHTSGTTGTPLQLWYDQDQLSWNRAAEKIVRSRAGLGRDDRVAMVYGRAVVPKHRRRPPYWMINDADREIWLSAFHVGTATAPLYFEAIRNYRAVALETYPSLAYVLARLAMELGEKVRFRSVITSSETLFPFQRETIEEAFGAEVFDFYAAAERVAFGVECKRHAGPHLLEAYGFVEPTRPNDGSGGGLVATGLTNRAMPLVRYQMGDVTRVIDEPCGCGLTSRRIAPVTTKQEDVLVTPDGRYVSPSILTHPFKPLVGVIRSQIVQESIDEVVVRLETAPGFDSAQEAGLVKAIVERMGPAVRVRLVKEPALEVERSGKFRWVISRVRGMHQLANGGAGNDRY